MRREVGSGAKPENGGGETSNGKSTDGGGITGDSRWSSFPSLLAPSGIHDFLVSPATTQVQVSDIHAGIVGLYFSANWNQRCRNFTHLLAGLYERLKSSSGGDLEIVFVSSDECPDAFAAFFASMPWLAVPFSNVEWRKALARRFDVEEIPFLVFLHRRLTEDHPASALRDGAELVSRYRDRGFPFTEERAAELRREEREIQDSQTLSGLLTNPQRDFLLSHDLRLQQQVPVASLTGLTIGLYFSAQWCRPCLRFTPKLISVYNKINDAVVARRPGGGEGFQIVFASGDREESDFRSYFSTMPWLALPFGDQNIGSLTRHFDVRGIPCLVILGPDGRTVTKNGRSLINLYGDEAYPFTRSSVELLEKRMEEEARGLPPSELHAGHGHELTLEGTGGGPFICCDCDEQGWGWAYQCLECGYEVHPKCVRPVGRGSLEGS